MKHSFLTMALALATTGLANAAPVTIDDFSAGQVIPAGLNGSVSDAGILGGERDVIANGAGTTFTAAGGSATFGTTGSANFVLLDYDGVDGSTAAAYLLGNVDLTGGGMNDRFLLNVTSLTGPVDWTVRVSESASAYNEGTTSITSVGLFEFTFASLTTQIGAGADFTGVERVNVRFNFDTNESITIDSLTTGSGRMQPVPEPSSAALMGLGLCALAAWRKKRRTI